MAPTQRRSALVESVAQALSFAISDPAGHTTWVHTQLSSNCKRQRGAEETRRTATVFDSSAIPPIGVVKYLMRLSATFHCSDELFVVALIVVDRLLAYDGGRLSLTMRNVHRVFLASLVVVVKYHEDLVYSNSHYAKAGGVHLKEVNRLERVILAALDFDLRVDHEQYQLYEAALLALSGLGHREEALRLVEGGPSKPRPAKALPTTTLPIQPHSSAIKPYAPKNVAALDKADELAYESSEDSADITTNERTSANRSPSPGASSYCDAGQEECSGNANSGVRVCHTIVA